MRPASAALLLLPLGACTDLPARDGPAPAHEMDIASTEFAFRMPDTIPAGLTRIRLTNEGSEHHHAQIARLHPGHTVTELRDTLAAGRHLPSWVTFVGGPGVPSTSTPGEVLVSLEPGTYAVLCFVSSADRVPHLAKGMMRELTVLPAAGPQQPEPRADATIVLDDYTFALTPGLPAGRRTIRVENVGPQPHEVEFIRLEPGKTAADALAWLKTHEGPPPGEAFGGTAALQAGQANYVSAEFTPGAYAMVCFVPDAGDGRPHTAHGMVREFRVD